MARAGFFTIRCQSTALRIVKESAMSTTASGNAYDDLVYPSLAFPQTHPDLLGTLATLFGLTPAPTERCRVLELGSASGANLLPLAYAWPESEFVGIDYSAKQVE